jgi:hypothetical protein
MKGRWLERVIVVNCFTSVIYLISACRTQSTSSDFETPASEISFSSSFVKEPPEIVAGALNHPYRANVEATWSLVLSDGQELTRDVTGFVSRDRLGDIREEGSLTRSGSKSVVNPTINRIYTINNATASGWSDGSTTARSIRLDEYSRTFFEDLAVPKSFHDFRFSLHNSFDKSIERSSEPLGTKIIGGVRKERDLLKRFQRELLAPILLGPINRSLLAGTFGSIRI